MTTSSSRPLHLSAGTIGVRDEGSGPPIVLLHPSPGDSRDFEAIISPLSQRYRVISFDWPGYGQSPAPTQPASASSYAALLSELLAALKIVEKVTLIGNSLGGFAAIRFALEQPNLVSGLILVAPGGFTAQNPATRLFCRVMAHRAVGRRAMRWLPRLYLRVSNHHTKAIRQRAHWSSRHAGSVIVFRQLWASFAEPTHDLRDQASDLEIPVHLVWGTRDPILPWFTDGRRAASLLPLEGPPTLIKCGHQPYAEVPGEFLTRIGPVIHRMAMPGGPDSEPWDRQ